jgi:drug/metabolite transporter (DMT)-like permease
VLVILADGTGGKSSGKEVLGNILTLLAAFAYALYSVMVQRLFPEGMEGDSILLFFGLMGCMHSVLMLSGTMWYIAKGTVVLWACAAIFGKGEL